MFKKYPKAGTACRIRLNLEWTLQKREEGGGRYQDHLHTPILTFKYGKTLLRFAVL